jgi:hypothetical protein
MDTIPIWRYDNGIKTLLHVAQVNTRDSINCNLPMYTWYQHARTNQVFATSSGKRVYLQDIIKGGKGPWVHANGNPLDFTNSNLIKVARNVRTVKRSEATSKSVGVCFVARRNRWKATLSGKLIGYFKTEEEAAKARVREVLTLSPMIQFIREGTDPDGPTGMNNCIIYHAEGGRPDAYMDPDDVEATPLEQYPVTWGSEPTRDRDYWKSIPPPDNI